MFRIITGSLVILLVGLYDSNASEQALSIETRVPSSVELAFPNESGLAPELSEFQVLSFVPMSNEAGERWAVLTIKNLASGRRTLSQKHLMALTADGNRINPNEVVQSFLADETLSIVVNFGERKFPLLSVFSRTEK
jgi:hypothetical protein